MSVYIDNAKAQLEKALYQKNAFTDILAQIESKYGVPRYIVLGAVVILGLYLVIGYGTSFLIYSVGFFYPTYASIKAIESPNKEDDKKWLTYWVVYSAFRLCEFVTDILFFWLPFLWFFKMNFLIYCMIPTSWNGSITIYNTIIRPWILKHQTEIEGAMSTASSLAQDVIHDGKNTIADAAVAQLIN